MDLRSIKQDEKKRSIVYRKSTVLPKMILKNITSGYMQKTLEKAISFGFLEALNPEMGDALKEGQVVTVPNIADNMLRTIDDTYGYYKVLPAEGYYRLKVKLGLTKD